MQNEPSEIRLAEGPWPTHLIHSGNISRRLCVLQKRVVNVYRLITRGTLEEKIMGLQKFKMSIANTVISQDNASMQSMGTDQLLNLFTLDKVRLQDGKKRSVWLNFIHGKKTKICMESDLIHDQNNKIAQKPTDLELKTKGISLLLTLVYVCSLALSLYTCCCHASSCKRKNENECIVSTQLFKADGSPFFSLLSP